MPDNIWINVPNYQEYHKRYQKHKISSSLFLIPHTKNVPDNTLLLGTLLLLPFSVNYSRVSGGAVQLL